MTPDAARKMWTICGSVDGEGDGSRYRQARNVAPRFAAHCLWTDENDDTLDRRRLRRPDVGSDACGCAGLTWHYEPDSLVGTPDVTFAPQQHLAQQYDPPSLPPEIMVPERRPVGRQRAAPPITVVPLDPLLPEPTPTAPAPAPTAPVESKPHPLAEWCGQEANAKAPLCRNVGSPRVQR